MKKVVFVLPTKNEERSIEGLILELGDWARALHLQYEIVVVDDSRDLTAEKARSLGAQVIEGEGVGLGYAMFKGLSFAARLNPDVIVSLDSDGQVQSAELTQFLEHFREGEADLLISSRFADTGLIRYRYPWLNFIGNRILVLILRLTTRLRLTDSHGGIRMMHPEVIRKHWQMGRHTYVQETLIVAKRNGFTIREIPSVWLERKHGDSRVLHSIWRYMFRTSPALGHHLGLHWILMGAALVCLVQWQSSWAWGLLAGVLMGIGFFLFALPRWALRYVEHGE